MTVFSYSGRVKSPEWRWQRRRADLRHFEIFRHGPIIIYTRLPAGGTCYPICTFPTNGECLIGISDAFFAFCLRVSVISPTCSLYRQQKRACSALHPQAWTYMYSSMPVGTYRLQSLGFPKIVYFKPHHPLTESGFPEIVKLTLACLTFTTRLNLSPSVHSGICIPSSEVRSFPHCTVAGRKWRGAARAPERV